MPESITGRTQYLPDEITSHHLYMLLQEVRRDLETLRTFVTTHTHPANNTSSPTALGSQNLLE